MDVTQIACANCGTVNEIVGRRTFGDYNPLCLQCKEPVRAKRPILTVGGRGDLQLRHLPGKGIGVFTRASVREGVLVERCPAYVLQRSDRGDVIERLREMEWLPYADSSMQAQTGYQMCLPWFTDEVRSMVLGYGMLYNHAPYAASNLSVTPYVDPDTNRRYVDYTAKDDIAARTELTVTYTRTADLWFHEKRGS